MAIYERYIKADLTNEKSIYEDYHIDAPDSFNYGFDVVDEIAKETPDKLALLYTNPAGECRRFTFDDIRRQSNRAANYFKSLGINKGDKVLVVLKRNYQYWFINVGLCKLGAVIIPATAQLAAKDISYRCNASSAKMILCCNDEHLITEVEAALPDSPTVERIAIVGRRDGWLDLDDGLLAMPDTFDRPTGEDAFSADDTMLIYFTSGTAGFPKMALHDFYYPLGHIATAKLWHTTREDDLHFTISDTGWAKAGWGKIYGQWLTGCAVFVYDFDRFHAKEILFIMEQYRITTFCAPPTMYRMLTQEPIETYDLSSLRHCCSAGEPLNPEVWNDWKRQTGQPIYEGFGQSETTCCLGTLPHMKIKPGSMGMPMPGYQIELLDEEGNPCGEGTCGEICIRLDGGKPRGLFNGYYRDECLTEKVWYDGFYHTGDTAWKDDDGYYWFVGRADDIIKSSGYRIGPFEVESALLEHPAVLEVAVTGEPDPVRGQAVKATIVLKSGYFSSDELKKDLQNHVKRVTAPYKYPRVIEFTDALPKTVSGKIKRAEIRKSYAAQK